MPVKKGTVSAILGRGSIAVQGDGQLHGSLLRSLVRRVPAVQSLFPKKALQMIGHGQIVQVREGNMRIALQAKIGEEYNPRITAVAIDRFHELPSSET